MDTPGHARCSSAGLMKGRRGEVDGINDVIVRGQRQLGGRAPINEKLIKIAAKIERGEQTGTPLNAGLLASLVRS